MIPTLLLAGLVVGLLSRPWWLAGLVVVSAGWVLLIGESRSYATVDVTSMIGEFAIAAVNTLIGVIVTRQVVRLVQALLS